MGDQPRYEHPLATFEIQRFVYGAFCFPQRRFLKHLQRTHKEDDTNTRTTCLRLHAFTGTLNMRHPVRTYPK